MLSIGMQQNEKERYNCLSMVMKQIYQEDGLGPADIAQKDGILYMPDLPESRILEFIMQAREKEKSKSCFF